MKTILNKKINTNGHSMDIKRIDLQDGRYLDIASILDPETNIVTVAIQKTGCLTNIALEGGIYRVYNGDYGLSIVSVNDLEGIDRETYILYDKYRDLIDDMIFKSYKN